MWIRENEQRINCKKKNILKKEINFKLHEGKRTKLSEQMQGYMQMKGDSYVNKSSQLITTQVGETFKNIQWEEEWEGRGNVQRKGKMCETERR